MHTPIKAIIICVLFLGCDSPTPCPSYGPWTLEPGESVRLDFDPVVTWISYEADPVSHTNVTYSHYGILFPDRPTTLYNHEVDWSPFEIELPKIYSFEILATDKPITVHRLEACE